MKTKPSKYVKINFGLQVKEIAEKTRNSATEILKRILPVGKYTLSELTIEKTGCNHVSSIYNKSIGLTEFIISFVDDKRIFNYEIIVIKSKFDPIRIKKIILKRLSPNQKQPQ